MSETQTTDIEVSEPEIEALPEAGGLVTTSKEGIDDLLYLADNIDKVIAAQNKIRGAIMGLAQPGDWVLFGNDKEKAGKAELGFAGAMRIASTLGVNFTNWEAKKEAERDDLGEFYRWEFEVDASYRNRTIRVYGRASSRDKLLGKVGGVYRPLHDIDEGNIKMIARRAAMKEGTKVLFGLHHMDPEYIKKFGITLVSAGGYSFKSQETNVAETPNAVSVMVEEAILLKSGKSASGKPWTLYKITGTEGDVFHTFSATDLEVAHRAKAAGTPVTISFTVTEKGGKNITSIK